MENQIECVLGVCVCLGVGVEVGTDNTFGMHLQTLFQVQV